MSRRGRDPWLVALLLAGDLAIVGASFVAGYALRFVLELGAIEAWPRAPFEMYVRALAFVLVIWPVIFQAFGLYDVRYVSARLVYAEQVAKAVTIGTVCLLALTFFVRDFSYSRLVFFYAWALNASLLTLFRVAVRRWRIARFKAGLDLRRAAILARDDERSAYLRDRIAGDAAFGLEIIGTVGPAPEPAAEGNGNGCAPLPHLGPPDRLEELIGRLRIEQLLILDPGLSHKELLDAIATCERQGVEVVLVPPIFDLLIDARDLANVNGVPLLSVNEARKQRLSLAVKRAFDVVASAALLLLLSPLLALIALAIKLGSRGPVLFRQQRAGEGGRPFTMHKFRTMVDGAEALLPALVDVEKLTEPVFKLERDPRVTSVGRLLRVTSLDELPQLWNVLRGDMSLVGPRPEEARLTSRYDVWQRRRLKVKPGITGLQQVEARGSPQLAERVRFDVAYIRRRSLMLDLYILARTVGAVLHGRGAR